MTWVKCHLVSGFSSASLRDGFQVYEYAVSQDLGSSVVMLFGWCSTLLITQNWFRDARPYDSPLANCGYSYCHSIRPLSKSPPEV